MDPDLLRALTRLLVAVCRADGDFDPDERAAVADLLFSLPTMDATTWDVLRPELDADVALDDALDALRTRLRDSHARQQVLAALQDFEAQGTAGAAEIAALRAVLQAIEEDGERGRGTKRLLQALRDRAGRLVRARATREDSERTLAERIAAAWPEGTPLPDEDTLHRMSVGAAILGHLVRLDGEIAPGEQEALRRALVERWGIAEAAADAVAERAIAEAAEPVDLYALVRDFFEHSDEDERQRFLAAVFRVAAGDGRASYDEIEEARRIGRGLLLSHRDFIAAKLGIDASRRDT